MQHVADLPLLNRNFIAYVDDEGCCEVLSEAQIYRDLLRVLSLPLRYQRMEILDCYR